MRVCLNDPRMEYFEWLMSHGFIQKRDEDYVELYSLSPQGLDFYHRRVSLIRETMKRMRI